MLLGIAGYAEFKWMARMLDGGAIGKESLIETLYLSDEVCGMGVSARCGGKMGIFFDLVTTEQKQIMDAKELEVKQLVLNILNGSTATDNMRLYGNMVTLLDSCCYSNGARATTHAKPLVLSVWQFAVDVFCMVRCDVNKGWIESCQLVNVSEELLCARTFEWRQYLKRILPPTGMFTDDFGDAHKINN